MNTIIETRNLGDITTIVCRDLDGCTHEFQVKTDDYQSYVGGVAIQKAFPYLNEDEREIIITGLTPAMWEILEESF